MTLPNQPGQSFDVVSDSVIIRSIKGKINSWNDSAAALYGWRKEEAIGRISHDLLHTQFPKPLQEIESELIRNRRWQGTLVHTTRDGGRVVVESRWDLDLAGESEGVIEINRPAPDPKMGSKVGFDANSSEGERGKRAAAGRIAIDGILAKLANIILAVGSFLCVLVGSYSSTRHFSNSLGKSTYLFVPIALAALLLASLKLKQSHKINLAILCVSLTASVLGMELYLEWQDSAPEKPVMINLVESSDKQSLAAKLTKEFGVKIDTRSAGEVIADLKNEGLDAIPFISPSNNLFVVEPDGSIKSAISVGGSEVMPLSGVSNKLTVLCNENGQWVSYRSDEHGFNNPGPGLWSGADIDIAAFGDSFTQGYCVPPEKSFMGIIRQRYPLTLNLGTAGDGPLMMLATMKEYLTLINPKIVLWVYCEDNDLRDLQAEKKSGLLMRYLKDDFRQYLAERQADIDVAMTKDIERQKALERERRIKRQQGPSIKDRFTELIKLTVLRKQFNLAYGMEAAEVAAVRDMEGANLATFAAILAQAKARVGESNGRLYFVYLPSWSRYANIRAPNIELRDRVLSIVSSLQIPIVDIHESFKTQKDPLSLFPFRKVGHYNEIGHRLVAEQLIKTLPSP